MGDPISLLIWIVIFALVGYLLFWALGQIPLPQPVRTVVIVVVVLIFVIWLLRILGFAALWPGVWLLRILGLVTL
jgi:hypothetical protein